MIPVAETNTIQYNTGSIDGLFIALDREKSYELHYRDGKCWIEIGQESYELREFAIISTDHSDSEARIRIGKSNLDKSVIQWYDAIIKIDFCYSLLKRDI